MLNTRLNQQNEIIKQSEAIKTRWFVNISHELKTPLTLIGGPVNKILQEDAVSSIVKDDLELVEPFRFRVFGDAVVAVADFLDARVLRMHDRDSK